MTNTRIVVAPAIDFGAVRAEFALDDSYPLAAVAEAEAAVDRWSAARVDRTDLPLVTIDPPGSMDLDQALHLERTVDGLVLHYAIADVAAVVAPDGALDRESRRRGQTYYLPDRSVPLHPGRCPRIRPASSPAACVRRRCGASFSTTPPSPWT